MWSSAVLLLLGSFLLRLVSVNQSSCWSDLQNSPRTCEKHTLLQNFFSGTFPVWGFGLTNQRCINHCSSLHLSHSLSAGSSSGAQSEAPVWQLRRTNASCSRESPSVVFAKFLCLNGFVLAEDFFLFSFFFSSLFFFVLFCFVLRWLWEKWRGNCRWRASGFDLSLVLSEQDQRLTKTKGSTTDLKCSHILS